MKKRIYFADLTYVTGVISSDIFPLGCGYDEQIRLIKYDTQTE